MSGKKAFVVSGATGAIGKAIAKKIASMNNPLVIIARNSRKAENSVNEIIQTTGNQDVTFKIADVTRLDDIQSLASSWTRPIHALINNAAVTPRTRQLSDEGIELQFATNVLGYFRMTWAFKDILEASAPARIVDVASYWAGDLDISDLEFEKRRYSNGTAYRQSKQANRMLISAWANRLRPKNITINACHPGDVSSTLSNNLGFGGSERPEQGADTPVWLATDAVVSGISGKYFERRMQRRCTFAANSVLVEELFKVCLGYNH